MTVNLSALAGAGQQFFNDSGVILSGVSCIHTQQALPPHKSPTPARQALPHTQTQSFLILLGALPQVKFG